MSLEWFLVLVCTGSYLKVLSGELSFPDGWNLFLIPTMIEANHWVQMHLLVAKAPVPKESAQVFSRVWTTPTFYRTGSRWSAGTGYDTINCPVIRHGKGQQRTNPFFHCGQAHLKKQWTSLYMVDVCGCVRSCPIARFDYPMAIFLPPEGLWGSPGSLGNHLLEWPNRI